MVISIPKIIFWIQMYGLLKCFICRMKIIYLKNDNAPLQSSNANYGKLKIELNVLHSLPNLRYTYD